MRFDRAARFGIYGTIGVAVITFVTGMLLREVLAGTEAGTLEGDLTVAFILIGATAVAMIFLFTLIGEYIDRELAEA